MATKDISNFMPLLCSDGALVLEGVAGIGKTFSIKEVRDYLSMLVDVSSLTELLRDLIDNNTGSPNGTLWGALTAKKDAVCVTAQAQLTIFVMHPSSCYEEFIGGLRPAPSPGGRTTFTWQPGKLTRAIADACKDLLPVGARRNHLIVLDEINRCNLPSVLGELIYLIEPSRRVTPNTLTNAIDSGNARGYLRDDEKSIPLGIDGAHGDLFIPSNLFFLGTMNSSDRSILGFDQALRRRFPPYRLEPKSQDDLKQMIEQEHGEPLPGDLATAIEAWTALNIFLRFVIGPDAMIGHSYWFQALYNGGDKRACDLAWRFGVLPQAVHAAESSRHEVFLADLFKTSGDPPGKNVSELADQFIKEHIQSREDRKSDWVKAAEACGRDAKFEDAKSLLPLIGKMDCRVRLVGSGHGEKLIVTEK